MKRIWSPWRMKYIMRQNHNLGCIFCQALEQEDGSENLIVYRGKKAFVILNRYPYTSGHLMVVPNIHLPALSMVDNDVLLEMVGLMARAEQVLRVVYNPEGFNIGANIGSAAGAGVAGHLHFHVVPRWSGDTNFMTTLADARVLPENLEDTQERLTRAWLDTHF